MLRTHQAFISLWFLCLALIFFWNSPILALSNFGKSGRLDVVPVSAELVVVASTVKRVLGAGEMAQRVAVCSALRTREHLVPGIRVQ